MLSSQVEAIIPENRFVSKMSKSNCNIIPPPYHKRQIDTRKEIVDFIILLMRFEGIRLNCHAEVSKNTDYVKGQAMESVFLRRKSL